MVITPHPLQAKNMLQAIANRLQAGVAPRMAEQTPRNPSKRNCTALRCFVGWQCARPQKQFVRTIAPPTMYS
jgi:hypothetical protein